MPAHPTLTPEEIPADLRHIQPITLGPEPVDARDYPLRVFAPRAEILPRRVRIENPFPVKNQGALGSCVGQAVASLLQLYFLRARGGSPEVSALHAYFLGRVIDGSWMADVGTFPRSALKGIMRWGAAPEPLWPYDLYDTSRCTTEPTYPARFQATFWRPRLYLACPTLQDVKASIAQGYGAAITVTLTKGFYDTRYSGGDVPDTYPGEPANGAHELLALGFDDDRGRVLALNSWGEHVGDRGYYTIPYSFWDSGDAYDCWTVR